MVSHGCGKNHWPLPRSVCSRFFSLLRYSKYGRELTFALGCSSGALPEKCFTASILTSNLPASAQLRLHDVEPVVGGRQPLEAGAKNEQR